MTPDEKQNKISLAESEQQILVTKFDAFSVGNMSGIHVGRRRAFARRYQIRRCQRPKPKNSKFRMNSHTHSTFQTTITFNFPSISAKRQSGVASS